MDGVDLEVAPIQRAVGVVVVDLTGAAGIFGALNGQRDTAGRAEFVAGVLLIGRQAVAELIGLRFQGVVLIGFGGNDERPLKVNAGGTASTDSAVRAWFGRSSMRPWFTSQAQLPARPSA
jgi:hypothetical protein